MSNKTQLQENNATLQTVKETLAGLPTLDEVKAEAKAEAKAEYDASIIAAIEGSY